MPPTGFVVGPAAGNTGGMARLPSAVTRASVSGMVSTVDHLATGVGVDLLRRGGSAADAAVGANAVLAVTSPHMCGPGGDVWALVHDGGSGPPTALDAAGFAGSGADPERLRAQGHGEMPLHGDVASVTVPGAVDGWLALHDRYGRLTLADVLAEAIRIADDGFAASPLLAERSRRGRRRGGQYRHPGRSAGWGRGAASRHGPGPSGPSSSGVVTATTVASSVRASSSSGRGSTTRMTWLGRSPRWVGAGAGRGVRSRSVDGAAHLAGLPDPGRGRGSPTASTWATPTTGAGPIC